jgi:hypothetical protein
MKERKNVLQTRKRTGDYFDKLKPQTSCLIIPHIMLMTSADETNLEFVMSRNNEYSKALLRISSIFAFNFEFNYSM